MYTYNYVNVYTYKLMGCMNRVLPLAAQDQIVLKASAAAKVAIEGIQMNSVLLGTPKN